MFGVDGFVEVDDVEWLVGYFGVEIEYLLFVLVE